MNPVATVLILICLLCAFLFVVDTNKFLKFKRLESRLKATQKLKQEQYYFLIDLIENSLSRQIIEKAVS